MYISYLHRSKDSVVVSVVSKVLKDVVETVVNSQPPVVTEVASNVDEDIQIIEEEAPVETKAKPSARRGQEVRRRYSAAFKAMITLIKI